MTLLYWNYKNWVFKSQKKPEFLVRKYWGKISFLCPCKFCENSFATGKSRKQTPKYVICNLIIKSKLSRQISVFNYPVYLKHTLGSVW